MDLSFVSAKNGQLTAQYNGFYFHSLYNPEAEAKRFADNIQTSYIPEIILITEPALGYCIPFLKEKFPECKFICIRYISGFEKYNNSFDAVLNYYEHSQNFQNYLFNYFGEEKIFRILFLKWETSGKIIKEIDDIVWNSIKSCLQKAKTLLVTREYFEKKWLLNSVNYFKYISSIAIPEKTSKPVLILASGPSLKPLLINIPEIKNKFYIICLSSAISVLKKYNIKPDLYLSTDGGYWAGQHLKTLRSNTEIPVALPSEAYVPKKLLQTQKIIPLNYGDGFSAELFAYTGLPAVAAERNGTVSGTALKLAMFLSNNDIYFTGLDLCGSMNESHTAPNEIELNNQLKDNRINSKEKRITRGGLNSSSLNIYKEWFCNLDLKGRKVFRIIPTELQKNSLGNIKDISPETFIASCEQYDSTVENKLFNESCIEVSRNLNNFIDNFFASEKNLQQLFPLDYTSLSHNKNDIKLIEKINNKKDELYSKINRILND